MRINKTIKPATPWNVSLAKLTNLEKTITASEGEALKARWLFGRELVSRRVNYKGNLGIPRDLMTLTMERCGVSRSEVVKRVRFATRYPTKDLMRNAITHYPSWYQMVHEGLVEKKRAAPKQPSRSLTFVLRRSTKELAKLSAQHTVLTRDDVKVLDELAILVKKLLDQVDRNDAARAMAS